MLKLRIADFESVIRRPNYLDGERVLFEEKLVDTENDGQKIERIIQAETGVKFPKDCPNMIDRGDRVNSSMHILANWNLMHVIESVIDLSRPYAKKVSIQNFRPTLVDTLLILKSIIKIQEETHKRCSGVLSSEFYDEVGRLHAKIECEFIARKNA